MSNNRTGTNYYEILEVAHDAPQPEIHKAYHRAKATYSQDNPALYSMFTKDEARELLKMIEEAYAILGSPSLRRSYDDSIAQISDSNLNTRSLPMMGSTPAQGSQKNATPKNIEFDHRALPDFVDPAGASASEGGYSIPADMAGVSDNYSVRKVESHPTVSLPPGMARTGISTYRIDDAFEAELATASDFDGNFLQRVRLYKNISIDKLSEATRISRTYLMAVETNDFKALPAAVFVRGFVVQIARVLGLNEPPVAASYMKMFKANGGK